MKFNWKTIGLAAALLLLVLGALYIVTKKKESFQNPSMPTFTMYYADWCGHCKSAKPEFESLVAKSPLDINGVKCNVRMVSPEKEPDLAKGKPIKGFPTFLMETPDGKVVEYKGGRSTDEYMKFLNSTLGGASGDVSGDKEPST